MNQLFMDSARSKEVAIILFDKFNSEEGIFGHNSMPEDILPLWNPEITSSEIRKGSYEHLMFITLVVSIDYQRDSDKLWEAGKKTFEDEQIRWLYYPSEITKKTYSEIQNAMKKYGLLKVGPNPKTRLGDVEIWSKVSKSFFEVYDSDPLNLLKQCNYDAHELFSKKFNLKFKQLFPYFSGDKIFPLWIRMLHDNLGFDLKKIEKIPIPVDVHVARATFTTGCLTGKYEGTIEEVFPKVDQAWEKAVDLISHPSLKYRLQLDESLWHLSKYGCSYKKGLSCPKKSECPVSKFCIDGLVKVSSKRIEADTGDKAGKTSLSDFVL